MSGIQAVYVGLLLFLLILGTVLTAVAIAKVPGWKRPLYWLRVAVGTSLSSTFVLSLLRAYFGLVLPLNTVLYVLEFALFLTACSLIATPIVDRHEARRLRNGV